MALALLTVTGTGAPPVSRRAEALTQHASRGAVAAPREEARPEKKPRPNFTISKETTYVTEPVDKDGYIDYEAALNKRLSQGVTPANNANVREASACRLFLKRDVCFSLRRSSEVRHQTFGNCCARSRSP